MRSTIFALLAISTVALACGGAEPPVKAPDAKDAPAADAGSSTPTTTTPPAAGDAGASASTDKPAPATPPAGEPMFDTLSKDKKVEVMMTKVVPTVGKAFKEHDAKRYEKFGCATCHGPKKNDDPHNVLPKLTFSNGGMEKLTKTKPEVMKFMSEKVVPTMAAAFGEKPYDPATKQGFGCAGCHTIN